MVQILRGASAPSHGALFDLVAAPTDSRRGRVAGANGRVIDPVFTMNKWLVPIHDKDFCLGAVRALSNSVEIC